MTLIKMEISVRKFQNKISLNFSNLSLYSVYKNQKFLKKSLLGRFKSIKEFLIFNYDYSFILGPIDLLRIIIHLKAIVILNYLLIYVKKRTGGSNYIGILTIYYKLFSYLCNLLFFPVVDFNSDKFSLQFRCYLESSDSILNLRNLFLNEKIFSYFIYFDVLYNFNIYYKLWLFKNFPTYKTLTLAFLRNVNSEFFFSKNVMYFFDVFPTFFNFSLNGLVCDKDIVLNLKFVIYFLI